VTDKWLVTVYLRSGAIAVLNYSEENARAFLKVYTDFTSAVVKARSENRDVCQFVSADSYCFWLPDICAVLIDPKPEEDERQRLSRIQERLVGALERQADEGEGWRDK
jgi:hypothetical protein